MEQTTGHQMQSRDTEAWAERVLFDHWRRMEPVEKAALLSDLCRSLHRLQLAGLAVRFPGADAQELELRAACGRLGRELVARVVGEERLPEGV